MDLSELNIAIHGAENDIGGIYNVLGSFTLGLAEGFKQIGVQTESTFDYIKEHKNFHVALGFNASAYNGWESIMKNNIPNIMWTVDSMFTQNFPLINTFKDNNKFIVFTVWSEDIILSKQLMPNLQVVYVPHATNPNLWQKTTENKDKDLDIIFLSSVCDYEERFKNLLNSLSDENKIIANVFYKVILDNPKLNFFDVYNALCMDNKLVLTAENFAFWYNSFLPILESALKVRTIQNLKDFPVKIFGNDMWLKYISGKQEYMGATDIKDTISVMNRAKICLHPHVIFYGNGLHERFLNASSVGTFVLSNEDKTIYQEFGDSYGYYTYENVADQMSYYLNNDDLRYSMQDKAFDIVHSKHCWINRANQIVNIFM